MGGSSTTTTVQQDTTPWQDQVPFYQDIFNNARNYFNTPMQYYPGETVADFSSLQKQIMQDITNRNYGTATENQMKNYATNLMNGGGYDWLTTNQNNYYASPTNQAYLRAIDQNTYKPMIDQAQQSYNTATSQYDAALKSGDWAGQQAYALYKPLADELTKTASGGYLNAESNPYLQDYYKKALSESMAAVNSNADKYGAYGSSDYQDIAAKTASDMATTMYYNNYENERNRQVQALSQGQSVSNIIQDPTTRYIQTQQAYASAMPGLEAMRQNPQQFATNAQQAAMSIEPSLAAAAMEPYKWQESLKQAGAAMVPTISALELQNLNNSLGIGQMYTDRDQKIIDEARTKWDWQQMEPWQRLGLYQGAIGGSLGASVNTETPYYQSSNVMNALGGALSGSALGSSFGNTGSLLGMLLGGGLGFL